MLRWRVFKKTLWWALTATGIVTPTVWGARQVGAARALEERKRLISYTDGFGSGLPVRPFLARAMQLKMNDFLHVSSRESIFEFLKKNSYLSEHVASLSNGFEDYHQIRIGLSAGKDYIALARVGGEMNTMKRLGVLDGSYKLFKKMLLDFDEKNFTWKEENAANNLFGNHSKADLKTVTKFSLDKGKTEVSEKSKWDKFSFLPTLSENSNLNELRQSQFKFLNWAWKHWFKERLPLFVDALFWRYDKDGKVSESYSVDSLKDNAPLNFNYKFPGFSSKTEAKFTKFITSITDNNSSTEQQDFLSMDYTDDSSTHMLVEVRDIYKTLYTRFANGLVHHLIGKAQDTSSDKTKVQDSPKTSTLSKTTKLCDLFFVDEPAQQGTDNNTTNTTITFGKTRKISSPPVKQAQKKDSTEASSGCCGTASSALNSTDWSHHKEWNFVRSDEGFHGFRLMPGSSADASAGNSSQKDAKGVLGELYKEFNFLTFRNKRQDGEKQKNKKESSVKRFKKYLEENLDELLHEHHFQFSQESSNIEKLIDFNKSKNIYKFYRRYKNAQNLIKDISVSREKVFSIYSQYSDWSIEKKTPKTPDTLPAKDGLSAAYPFEWPQDAVKEVASTQGSSTSINKKTNFNTPQSYFKFESFFKDFFFSLKEGLDTTLFESKVNGFNELFSPVGAQDFVEDMSLSNVSEIVRLGRAHTIALDRVIRGFIDSEVTLIYQNFENETVTTNSDLLNLFLYKIQEPLSFTHLVEEIFWDLKAIEKVNSLKGEQSTSKKGTEQSPQSSSTSEKCDFSTGKCPLTYDRLKKHLFPRFVSLKKPRLAIYPIAFTAVENNEKKLEEFLENEGERNFLISENMKDLGKIYQVIQSLQKDNFSRLRSHLSNEMGSGELFIKWETKKCPATGKDKNQEDCKDINLLPPLLQKSTTPATKQPSASNEKHCAHVNEDGEVFSHIVLPKVNSKTDQNASKGSGDQTTKDCPMNSDGAYSFRGIISLKKKTTVESIFAHANDPASLTRYVDSLNTVADLKDAAALLDKSMVEKTKEKEEVKPEETKKRKRRSTNSESTTINLENATKVGDTPTKQNNLICLANGSCTEADVFNGQKITGTSVRRQLINRCLYKANEESFKTASGVAAESGNIPVETPDSKLIKAFNCKLRDDAFTRPVEHKEGTITFQLSRADLGESSFAKFLKDGLGEDAFWDLMLHIATSKQMKKDVEQYVAKTDLFDKNWKTILGRPYYVSL